MRISVARRTTSGHEPPRLIEVVTPRTNVASLTSAENLLGAVAVAEPFALEIAADHQARRFLVRVASDAVLQHLRGQLGASYPQAMVRTVEPTADPTWIGSDEQVARCALVLRAANYLPIRTFSDLEIDALRSAQADPILGILGGMANLPPGWRALSQLIIEPAPDTWSRDYLRLAVQHPLTPERIPRASESSLPSLALLAVVLGTAAMGLQAYEWYRAAQWTHLVGMGALGIGALGGGLPLAVKLLSRPVYDMDLVREKVSRAAYRCELRLSVFGPANEEPRHVRERLAHLASAYRQYSLAAGNSFRVRNLKARSETLAQPTPVARRGSLPILTTRELAGLWHLPQAAADVGLVERTTARRWLPKPGSLLRGCRIGVTEPKGEHIPVDVPEDVLRRNLLMVAKTRRGKSTLMLRLAQHAMAAEPRRAVLLIDPHSDLAAQAAAIVPPEREADVVYLDLADMTRSVGLNLLDVGLGWSDDRVVSNALDVFRREFGDRSWGPRMESVFRNCLQTLAGANSAFCASNTVAGRTMQYTLLDVPPLLHIDGFRRAVLAQITDLSVKRWWADYYDPLERRFQMEIHNPVLTKIHRFEGNTVARRIVGQPASTIDPRGWLRDGNIVIVNTARGALGENVSALLGATILNLMARTIFDQVRLAPEERRGMSIFVDEFHSLPGADYEGILSELGKFGANLVLATQSLARLVDVGAEHDHNLRGLVFSNIDGLFAFNCSAEDAEYLVPELGSALDVQDLVELGEHKCYVRLSSGGERLPCFSVHLDPPLASDPELRARIAAESALRYARDAAEIDADVTSSIARVALLSKPAKPAAVEPAKPRNEHRRRNKRPRQETLTHA